MLEFGRSRTRLLVGEVLMVHLDPSVHEGVKVHSERLQPLARLAGPNYAGLGEILSAPPASRKPATRKPG